MKKREYEMRVDAKTAVDRFEDAEPDTTPPGRLCMLCDSTAGCSHPQKRCFACGAVGLAENMTEERHRCREEMGQ